MPKHYAKGVKVSDAEMSQLRITNPNDLLNMTNEFLTYGGRKLDIGRNSIRRLKEIVCKLQLAVLYDSLEALETTDQRRLDMLLRKDAREVNDRRATTKAKRSPRRALRGAGLCCATPSAPAESPAAEVRAGPGSQRSHEPPKRPLSHRPQHFLYL